MNIKPYLILFLATVSIFADDAHADTKKTEETAPALDILSDLDAAKEKSKASGKPVFLEFMSSTCGHCLAFKKNVLSDPGFIEYANKNLIVVIHDYHELPKLAADEAKKRKALMETLKVEGFPTILLINKDGEILLRTSGYGGAKASVIIESLKMAAADGKS